MKLVLAAAAVLIAVPANAQTLNRSPSTLANVPTGFQVQGCTYYIRNSDGTHKQICPEKLTSAERVRIMAEPSQFTTGSGGTASVANDK